MQEPGARGQEPKSDKYRIEVKLVRYSPGRMTPLQEMVEWSRVVVRGINNREEAFRIARALDEHAQAEEDYGQMSKN